MSSARERNAPGSARAAVGDRYEAATITRDAPHIRNALDVPRVMLCVVAALLPCLVLALWNAGHRANAGSMLACLLHGLLEFAPLFAVVLVVGGGCELLFARARGRRVTGIGGLSESTVLVALLFALYVPPSLPLWQAALGIAFAIVIGREVFGGTGRNFANPAMVGLAFVSFAYPASLSGASAWIAIDGLGTATPLACLIGVAILLYTGVASERVVAAGAGGAVAAAVLIGASWYSPLSSGTVTFGLVFLATDPVSAAATNAGRWIYGALVGCLAVLLPAVNPSLSPSVGVMLAILLGNVFAPLIDHTVARANARRRSSRG